MVRRQSTNTREINDANYDSNGIIIAIVTRVGGCTLPDHYREWMTAGRTRIYKDGRPGHGERTRNMNGSRAATVPLSLVVIVAAVAAASTGPPPHGRSLAAVDGCHAAAWWPRCVAGKIARTLRLLEQACSAADLQIAEGVRLVKTANRSTEYVFALIIVQSTHLNRLKKVWTKAMDGLFDI